MKHVKSREWLKIWHFWNAKNNIGIENDRLNEIAEHDFFFLLIRNSCISYNRTFPWIRRVYVCKCVCCFFLVFKLKWHMMMSVLLYCSARSCLSFSDSIRLLGGCHISFVENEIKLTVPWNHWINLDLLYLIIAC